MDIKAQLVKLHNARDGVNGLYISNGSDDKMRRSALAEIDAVIDALEPTGNFVKSSKLILANVNMPDTEAHYDQEFTTLADLEKFVRDNHPTFTSTLMYLHPLKK